MIGTHIFLFLIGGFMVLPIIYMISTSMKPYEEFFLFPPRLFVRRPTIDHFTDLLFALSATWIPFSRYVVNSVFVTTVTVGLVLVIQSMAAYPLAKLNFVGKKVIMILTMAAFMFAPQVTEIPRFLVVNALGFINTYWALIIPQLAQPFMVFLLASFMAQVPSALIESAKMDGASHWFAYRRVAMPLVKPALATVLILVFIRIWNDPFSPIVYIRNEALKTMPVVFRTITGGASIVARQGPAAAAGFLMAAPMMIIFIIVQRQVMETMAFSGIKG